MLEDLNPRYLLPRPLRSMWPAAKLLWLYFNLTGPVTASQRDLSVHLGLTQRPIADNLIKLSEAGLIIYKPGSDRASKSVIKAKQPIFSPIERPFPGILKEADASTKVLYLWLLPQGDVTYTLKQVSAYLGITEMTAVKARQELESFGVINYKLRPAPRRHGIYYVLAYEHLKERLEPDSNLALPQAIEQGMAAELKLYWLVTQRGEITAHQQTLATMLDIPQSSVSKVLNSLLEKDLIQRVTKKGEDVLVSARTTSVKSSKTPKDIIPDKLKGEANAVQFLYMWLKLQGKVSYSYSDIVELVRLRSYSVMKALERLEELKLLNVYQKPTPHSKGTFKVV
jgi:DNA-binding MarR family transcriptional regulator